MVHCVGLWRTVLADGALCWLMAHCVADGPLPLPCFVGLIQSSSCQERLDRRTTRLWPTELCAADGKERAQIQIDDASVTQGVNIDMFRRNVITAAGIQRFATDAVKEVLRKQIDSASDQPVAAEGLQELCPAADAEVTRLSEHHPLLAATSFIGALHDGLRLRKAKDFIRRRMRLWVLKNRVLKLIANRGVAKFQIDLNTFSDLKKEIQQVSRKAVAAMSNLYFRYLLQMRSHYESWVGTPTDPHVLSLTPIWQCLC